MSSFLEIRHVNLVLNSLIIIIPDTIIYLFHEDKSFKKYLLQDILATQFYLYIDSLPSFD